MVLYTHHMHSPPLYLEHTGGTTCPWYLILLHNTNTYYPTYVEWKWSKTAPGLKVDSGWKIRGWASKKMDKEKEEENGKRGGRTLVDA